MTIALAVTCVFASACADGGGTASDSPAEPQQVPTDPANLPAGPIQGPGYTPTGPIVADLGFRPPTHGFAFENYGAVLADGSTPTDLTPDDIRTMFGDEVCIDATAAECTLIPEGEAWQQEANAAIAAGHCYGFAVGALLLWHDPTFAAQFGAPATNQLGITSNVALQRQIASKWVMQTLDSVRSTTLSGTPNQILNTLKDVLRPNPAEVYTLVIWKEDLTAGHAITPYAVEDRGAGIFNVLLYDNNWPTETRAMTFDTNADTWSYDAAINPDEPNALYTGGAESENIGLYPTTPGLGLQPCPFCDTREERSRSSAGGASATAGAAGATAAPTAAPATQRIYLRGSHTDHAHLLVTDGQGRRVGYVDGKFVQEIPGARIDRLAANQTWKVDLPPQIVVPAGEDYTITLDGSELEGEDTESIGVIGPDFSVAVGDIDLRRGDRNVLTVGAHAEDVSYAGSRAHNPAIRVAVSEAAARYAFELRGVAARKGSTLRLSLPTGGGSLGITDSGSTRTSKVRLTMRRFTKDGIERFRNAGIELDGNALAELRFGRWTGRDGRIPLTITRGGERSTTDLRNED